MSTVVIKGTTVKVVHTSSQGLPGKPGSSQSEVQLTAGVALGGHRVVTPGPQGLVYADWDTISHAMCVAGVTVSAVGQGGLTSIRNYGELVETSWNWTMDKPVFLGPNGTLTQANPADAGAAFSLVVGFPSSPTKLFINIREPILLT